jgi:protein TonB
MTATVVAGLHLAAVTAFVVAMKPNLLPLPHYRPITATFIPERPTPPKAEPPGGNIKLVTPSAPQPIPDPIVEIAPESQQNPITASPPARSDGKGASLETFIAAQGIAQTHTIPPYPPIETRLDHEGDVLLKLSIDSDGAVADAAIAHSSGYPGLDNAAVGWVKVHWRYVPAMRGGIATVSTAEVTVRFRLTQP